MITNFYKFLFAALLAVILFFVLALRTQLPVDNNYLFTAAFYPVFAFLANQPTKSNR